MNRDNRLDDNGFKNIGNETEEPHLLRPLAHHLGFAPIRKI